MLEAAAAGTACVALPIVENQKRQVDRLARVGAVRVVEPPHADSAVNAVVELARDLAGRRELSRRGQRAIDGYGAFRVAFRDRTAGAPGRTLADDRGLLDVGDRREIRPR